MHTGKPHLAHATPSAQHYDVIIVGTGMGGGTLAYALKDAGARIVLLERGDFLPRERENWDVSAVFGKQRYKNAEQWFDPMIVRSCTPSSRRSVAAVWRASWRRPSRTPAVASRRFQPSQSVRGLTARPVSSAKIHPSSDQS